MRKKKFGIIRKRILSFLLATMMVSSSAVTVFATDDISFSDDTTTEITEQIPDSEETDSGDETPAETDVTDETPAETDVTDETPAETDVSEEIPDETDVTEEFPEGSEIAEEESSDDVNIIEHYISDVEGEGVLPYEYYVVELNEAEADGLKATYSSVQSYYSSYYSSDVRYNSTVGYNSLTSAQKEAYDELYAIACKIDESASYDATLSEKYNQYYFPEMSCSISLDEIDSDSLFKAYVALKNDNPQFFWMGHGYVSWTSSTHIVAFQFGVDDAAIDYIDGDYRMQVKEELFEEIEAVLEGAEAYGNDYSKEWYIHNYLCEATVYDLEGPHAHDISGLILDGRAVCESYAKCFQLFMNALGIDVLYVTGTGNGGGHAWNQIGLDNNGVTEWYNVDVTWDDDDDGYGYYYFNVVDSDGTVYDFTDGFVSNGTRYNEHTPQQSGDREYIYPVNKCTSTTYAYKNHAKNYELASTEPVAKVGETEYTSLEDAAEATTEGDTITLLSDVSYNGFTMPSHHIIIDCAGFVIDLEESMDMNADLTIRNVGGKTLDELGGAYEITDVDYEYIYINDNTLSFEGTWSDYLPAFISGYDNDGNETGTLSVDLEDDNICGILEAVGMAEFVIAENEYVDMAYEFIAVDVIINDNSVLSTAYGWGEIANLTISDTAWLSISTEDKNPFFIIYDEITGDVVNVKAANMEEGLATVVTRLKYPVDKFNFVYITDEGEKDYYVTRINNGENLYLYGPFPTADFTVSDGTDEVKRCTFAEATEYIEEQNSPSTKYTITYTGEEDTVCIENDINFESGFIVFDGAEFRFEGNVSGDAIIEFFKGAEFVGYSVNGADSKLKIFGVNEPLTFEGCDISDVHIESRESADVIIDGCDVSESDILIMSADLQILDSKKLKPDVHFESIGLVGGEIKVNFNGINTIYVDNLETSHAGDIINFNSGKVEIKDIVVNSGIVFNIKSGDILSVTGQITRDDDSSYIYVESETVENGQKIMNISLDYSQFFRTEQVNSEGNPIEVVYRAGALVYDVPVFRLEGVGIFSEWDDILSYINKNGSSESDFDITLLCDAEIKNLTLPTAKKANSITFSGENILTLGNKSLSVPIDTFFDCELSAENTAITASKNITLSDATVKSLTGARTSQLDVSGTVNAQSVKTFLSVNAEGKLIVGDNATVTDFAGHIAAENPDTVISIAKAYESEIILVSDADEKFAKVTVNDVAEGGILTVTVVNAETEVVPISSGTIMLYTSGNDISEKIEFTNRMENDGELKAYYYAKSKAVKAEWPYAATLSYEENGEEISVDCPNLNRAFDIINANKDKTIDYTITLNVSTDYTSMTLPTYANSITFDASEYTTFTYTGKTLKLPVSTYFECDFNAENTAITASKNAGFYNATVKSITGTKTSELSAGTLNAQSIKTFATVSGNINIDSDMTVTEFEGNVRVNSPETTVSIAKVSEPSGITLISDETGVFGKVTVGEVAEGATLTVNVIDAEGNDVTLESGTTILYTAGKDLSGSVTILNKTSDEKALTPFYYSKTKSVNAEWADAMTLSYNGVEKNLPNIDKIFEEINANKDKTANYTITFNAPVTFDKLTIPTYANSITFAGEKLTFTGKTLKFPVNTTLDCNFSAENTAVTASKDITLSNATVKSLAGTLKSNLAVLIILDAQTVKTFATVSGNIHISSDITVTGFEGLIRTTTPDATVKIATVVDSSDIWVDSDENGKFGKITITDVAEDATITVNVVDENENDAILEGGTIVLYTTGKDLSESVIILNETPDGKPLTPFYYKKNKCIKAEWEDTITLSYGETIKNLPNIDKAFEEITSNKDKTADYTIKFNTPATFDKLTIPTYANSITFTGENMTFTGKTLKLPVNTVFECDLAAENAAVTASKNVTFVNADVKSLTGTAKSILTVSGTVDAPIVKTFLSVNSYGNILVSGTMSGISNLSGKITLETTDSDVTITRADVINATVVADENGNFGKLTVNGTTETAGITVNLVDTNGDTIAVTSGTPVIYSPSDISGKVYIANDEDLMSTYYADKEAVYAEYADAVSVSYVVGEDYYENSYPILEKAFADIPLDAENITIDLNRDVREEEFNVPKFKNGITINGDGYSVFLDNVTSVSLATFVCFERLTLDSTDSFKMSTTEDMILINFSSSTLSALSGKGTKSLMYHGGNTVNYKVSGFGTLDLSAAPIVHIENSVTVKNVVYSGAELGIRSGANVKFTNLNPMYPDNFDPVTICYYDDEAPVTISGTVSGNIVLKHQSRFTSGEQLFVASKADLSKFTLYENSLPDEKQYILTRKSGKVYIKPIILEVSDETNNYKYAEWSDFVAMVNEEKTPETFYTVTLLGDYNVGGALTMPKAGYYKRIILRSADATPYTLTFTGGIKQTGEIIFDTINLRSVNSKGVETSYTITTGKYACFVNEVDFGNIKSLTGTTGSEFAIVRSDINGGLTAYNADLLYTTIKGAVKTTNMLSVNDSATFENTVNVYGLTTPHGDCSITLRKGKLLTVGKGGSGEDTITINLETPVTAKTKVGTIAKDCYNGNFVGGNVDIAVEGTTIYAYPKA